MQMEFQMINCLTGLYSKMWVYECLEICGILYVPSFILPIETILSSFYKYSSSDLTFLLLRIPTILSLLIFWVVSRGKRFLLSLKIWFKNWRGNWTRSRSMSIKCSGHQSNWIFYHFRSAVNASYLAILFWTWGIWGLANFGYNY